MLTEGIIIWVTLAIINHNLAESNNYHTMSLAVEKFLQNINGPTGKYLRRGAFSSISSRVSSEERWDMSLRLQINNNRVRFCSAPFIKITVMNL